MCPPPSDERYLKLIQSTVDVCRLYTPKFGKGGKGITKEEFATFYHDDPFYTWMGLDSPLMFAAHKAAGGITSVYRQIGMACEHLFRQVLQDTLGLTEAQAKWNYTTPGLGGKTRILSLDGRIAFDEIADTVKADALRGWVGGSARELGVDPQIIRTLQGAVFEVRQGYKSKDAKRQNADLANAASAYTKRYLPSVVLFSTQIDPDLEDRYRKALWLFLKGTLGGSPRDSLYVFSREILGYDLAGFFARNSPAIRVSVNELLECLLE